MLVSLILVLTPVARLTIKRNSELLPWARGCGLTAFFTWVFLAIVLDGVASPGVLLANIIRAITIGGLVWVLSGIAFPIFDALAEYAWRKPGRQLIVLRQTLRGFWRRKQQAEPIPESASPQSDPEPVVSIDQGIAAAMQEQMQRDDLRLDAQLFFDLHRDQLANKFTEERLAEYFERFMADHVPVDVLAQRSERLHAMLQEHLTAESDLEQHTFTSFEDVANHYAAELEKLASLDLAPEMREQIECEILEAQALAFGKIRP